MQCTAFNFDPTPRVTPGKEKPEGSEPCVGTRLPCELETHGGGDHRNGLLAWRYDGGVPFKAAKP